MSDNQALPSVEPYRATRRDEFAIRVANRWLRLVASRRCVALIGDVYRRGLHPLGTGFYDPINYDGLFDYQEEAVAVGPSATGANPLVDAPWLGHKEVGRLAIRVEGLLSRLRTDAVLRPRWYRPSWQAGREQGLAEAHEAVQQMLNERGLPHFGPRQTDGYEDER